VAQLAWSLILGVFPDADKQAAINLFLGIYNERAVTHPIQRAGYRRWFHEEHFSSISHDTHESLSRLQDFTRSHEDFWVEYYQPLMYTPLAEYYAFTMNSSSKLPE
jgi:phosphatidylinositol 3,5-bisphosphate 5-phosphatase